MASTRVGPSIRGRSVRISPILSSLEGEQAGLDAKINDSPKTSMRSAIMACGEGLARALVLSVATLAAIARRLSTRLEQAGGDFRWATFVCLCLRP